jgi:ATP-dependent Clp protease ATP-binding subunit ClpA
MRQPNVVWVEVAELIATVELQAPEASTLERVSRAVLLADHVGAAAEATVTHFVDLARAEGRSWTEIGQQLGVSKQAARKRFVEASTAVGEVELVPRLQACLQAAQREAERDGVNDPGGQHLLIGLLAAGWAANVLSKLGVDADRVRAEASRLFPPPPDPDSDRPLEAARRFAAERGFNYVGTEHLLFVMAGDPGSRARRILDALDVSFADIKRELDSSQLTRPVRKRRRFGRADVRYCSFCGRSGEEARLVGGPGVNICSSCVEVAAQVLAPPDA